MTYDCPHCQSPVEDPAVDAMGAAVCPLCGQAFSIPEPEAAASPPVPEDDEPDRLDSARVRMLAARKKSLLRMRSFAVIGLGLLSVGAVMLLGKAVRGVAAAGGVQPRQAGFVLFGLGCLYGAWVLVGVARRLTREFNRPTLPDPETPPDFTGLGDGSQRWKNLEDVK